MKIIVPVMLGLLLSGCNWNDDDRGDHWGCENSSDYQEFECINRRDFRDADGNKTNQSRTLAACTILASTDPACAIGTLPFLASEGTPPTREQVLGRLIVSHQWMADNFALLLEDMPDDMLNLFASVTAIVIHDEIRPAFFWPETGAIYLDPYYLWMTPSQYSTISTDPDYRNFFGNDLKFVGLARYTKNGSYAFGSGSTRTRQQALYALSAVLFHELAHARDHFPSAEVFAPDPGLSPGSLAGQLVAQQVSTALPVAHPLLETLLFDMADVLYRGVTASDELLGIDAIAMGNLLAGDGANDDYAYVSNAEDVAMLFEETMMQRHYDVDREIVYATPLNLQQDSCDDFTFDWTAINRFAQSAVLARASFVVDGLLPGHGHAAWLATPGADGVFTWCQPTPAARGFATPSTAAISRDYWH